MKEIVVHNWDELQKAVFQNVWDEKIQRYRTDCIYRGTSEKEWGMIPSLNRYCGHNLDLEQSVIRSFKKYGYADLVACTSFWQIIAMAQHHGLPTRLLDWTYSPLVAAHFATEDISKYDHDGAIWCVNIKTVNRQLPSELLKRLNDAQSNMFTVEMLDRQFADFHAMKAYAEKPYVLFFEPSAMLDRIANQYSLFSVVSDSHMLLSDVLEDRPGVGYKIIIPREVKLEIRDKLDYINISERMIYPGLDGICKWITRQYSALGPVYNKNHHGEETRK